MSGIEREAFGEWVKDKPSKPGWYAVRGFSADNAAAAVTVADDNGELVCNLHQSNSDPVEKFGYLVSELGDQLEWQPLTPHPTTGAWLLRKQAEAVEAATRACEIKSATDDSKCYSIALMDYADELRCQAGQAERAAEQYDEAEKPEVSNHENM